MLPPERKVKNGRIKYPLGFETPFFMAKVQLNDICANQSFISQFAGRLRAVILAICSPFYEQYSLWDGWDNAVAEIYWS